MSARADAAKPPAPAGSLVATRRSPSAWPPRIARLFLAFGGGGIATYLGLYQLEVFATVWEPWFGEGSHVILRESWISNLLPIPDALLGAMAYYAEGIAAMIGGRTRWRTLPRVVLAESFLIASLALMSLLLAVAQPTLFGAGCTLCLITTALSLPPVALAAGETRATLRYLSRRV